MTLTQPEAAARQLPPAERWADPALLDPVRTPSRQATFASCGPNFMCTIFGRDNLETSEDTYELDKELAYGTVLTLAPLQGTRDQWINEEEIGKTHHEFRTIFFEGQPVPQGTIDIMRKLMAERGEPDADTMIHYDTYDATPLYIRLIGKIIDKYGDELLARTYIDKDGIEQTVLHSVELAMGWVVGKLNLRDDHLMAYKRSNTLSMQNHVWKDSRTSYMFSDGTLPDHDKGIVSAELQGYSYDALLVGARLFPHRRSEFLKLAKEVQQSTIQKLWMPDKQYFAQGLGVHQSGEEKIIDTITSNGALLADSNILLNLPRRLRTMFINGIERIVMGPELFVPGAGIRCRGVSHAGLLPYVDYHGSYAVWPKESSDIARGLQMHGRMHSAIQIRRAIKTCFEQSDDFYELTYVDIDPDSTCYYNPDDAVAKFMTPDMPENERLPRPEKDQAWSRSAAILTVFALDQMLHPKFAFRRAVQSTLALRRESQRLARTSLTQLLTGVQMALGRTRIK
jgi:glycogen debranching enzyme